MNKMSGLSYAQILAKGNSGGSGGESSGGAAEEFRSSRTLPRNFGNSSRESGSGSGQGTIQTCQMLSFVIPHPGCLKPGGRCTQPSLGFLTGLYAGRGYFMLQITFNAIFFLQIYNIFVTLFQILRHRQGGSDINPEAETNSNNCSAPNS